MVVDNIGHSYNHALTLTTTDINDYVQHYVMMEKAATAKEDSHL